MGGAAIAFLYQRDMTPHLVVFPRGKIGAYSFVPSMLMSEQPSNTNPNSQPQKTMLDRMSTIQAFYYGAFVQARACDEETDGEAYTGAFIRRMGQRLQASTTPASVQAAHRYYYEHVEQQDWGGVGVYQVMVAETCTYAVHTTCDGDEQWLARQSMTAPQYLPSRNSALA